MIRQDVGKESASHSKKTRSTVKDIGSVSKGISGRRNGQDGKKDPVRTESPSIRKGTGAGAVKPCADNCGRAPNAALAMTAAEWSQGVVQCSVLRPQGRQRLAMAMASGILS